VRGRANNVGNNLFPNMKHNKYKLIIISAIIIIMNVTHTDRQRTSGRENIGGVSNL
jgi:hypothetical protein